MTGRIFLLAIFFSGSSVGRQHGFPLMSDEQVMHVIGVLLLIRQNAFHHHAGRWISVTEVPNQLAIMITRDPLGDQVSLIISIRFPPTTY
jgi:hypothetical protein